MNAGAYGREIKDVLVEAEPLDPARVALIRLRLEDLGFSYRHSSTCRRIGSSSAPLRGRTDDPAGDRPRACRKSSASPQRHQPIRSRTGGSTFKNPRPAGGLKAWELIDKAGCRGLKQGGARSRRSTATS